MTDISHASHTVTSTGPHPAVQKRLELNSVVLAAKKDAQPGLLELHPRLCQFKKKMRNPLPSLVASEF